MEWWHAIVLGIIEGITEFLPISSTGHLTIAEKLMGYDIGTPSMTAFTAVIQIGAILAAVLYFRDDIWRIGSAWVRGIVSKKDRTGLDYQMGWSVIIGSIPIAIIGLVFKHEIETVFRSLWFVVAGLILWSGVMFVADRRGRQTRHERDVTWRDTLIIGLTQCFALIPGVSRSGATISAGLLLNLDRVTATRLSFFLGIPALAAAGLLEVTTQASHITTGVGWTATILGIVASFIVGYISIAWLLKFISQNDFSLFIWYRLVLGGAIIGLLMTNVIGAM